jgi:hypothetical protein
MELSCISERLQHQFFPALVRALRDDRSAGQLDGTG